MINREATIRWKDYDPDDLSPGSNKRVWAVCEKCGKGRWVVYSHYSDLCKPCSIIKTSKIPKWIRNHKKGIEKMCRNPKWIVNQKKAGEKRSKDPIWIKSHKKAAEKRSKDPIWLGSIKEAAEKRSKDPIWIKNNKIANQKKANDPVICRKISASRQGISYEEWNHFIWEENDWRDWSKVIYLNGWFDDCHRHHITETVIARIPSGLHRHIRHCLKTGHNMGEMNTLALQYVFGDILCSIYNGCDIR